MAIITADMQNIRRSQPVRELQDRKLARRDNFMIFFVVVEIALNILDTEIKSVDPTPGQQQLRQRQDVLHDAQSGAAKRSRVPFRNCHKLIERQIQEVEIKL